MSWTDFLEDLSAGASGVVSGLTQGAKPFDAWEKVRTQDLANDKSELTLRDLYQMQDALENPDLNYYGNAAAAKDSGNRKTFATNEVDIFGNQQKLDMARYFSDPDGFFQMKVRHLGIEPGSPEYRALLAEQIAQFDPTAGVKAYGDFKIPELENRNLNEQAALRFLESYAQRKDPNAVVRRNPDGTVSILSNGEETPISGDLLVQVASMINAKTPYDAISQGYKDEAGIQKNNIELLKALRDGKVTPTAAVNVVKENGVRLNQLLNDATRDYNNIIKSQDYQIASPDEKVAMVEELGARIKQLRQRADENVRLTNQLVQQYALPQLTGARGGMPNAGRPRVGPQGGSSVTTRPPPGSGASRMLGGTNGSWDVLPPAPRAAGGPSARPPVQVLPSWWYGEQSPTPSSYTEGMDEFMQLIGGA